MALKPYAVSASTSWSAGVVVQTIEVIPDGGELDVRIYYGSDATGTMEYRIRATERSEFRDYQKSGGILFRGPSYIDFYAGEGTVCVTTNEDIS